ncbi:hypothetical protein HDU97_005111 [Phlyctochytrium planicorne]|nr:hypothetical protein HDU97_005111 [Phlyctochytrium planicorne]
MPNTSFTKILAILGLFAIISIDTVSAAESCPSFTFGNKTELIYRRVRTCIGQSDFVTVFFDNNLYWQPKQGVKVASSDVVTFTPNPQAFIYHKNVLTYTLPAPKVNPTRITFDNNAYIGVKTVQYTIDTTSVPNNGWKDNDLLLTSVSATFQGCTIDATLNIKIDKDPFAQILPFTVNERSDHLSPTTVKLTMLSKILAIFGLAAVISINTVSAAASCPTFTFGNKTELIYHRIRTCIGQSDYVTVFFDNNLYWQPKQNVKVASSDVVTFTSSASAIYHNGGVTYALPAPSLTPTRITFENNAYIGVKTVQYKFDTTTVPNNGWKDKDTLVTTVSATFQGCTIDLPLTIDLDIDAIGC